MALDPKTWGTYNLHGKTGNSDEKIKWFGPSRLGSFIKYMGCNLGRCNSSTLFGMFS